MILTALPRASLSQDLSGSACERLDPFVLVVSVRVALVRDAQPSLTISSPPASSMRIAIDVPERGRPETTTIGLPNGIWPQRQA